MNEEDIKKYLHQKLKLPELVTAALETRHREFGFNTFREYVSNQTRYSAFRTKVNEDTIWQEIMEFLVKRYG